LENPIATLLLEEKFVAGDTIYIDRGPTKLVFDTKPPVPKEEKPVMPVSEGPEASEDSVEAVKTEPIRSLFVDEATIDVKGERIL
jgi:ATP-dependent Clp protease ATP-binding subunit ClpB